MNSLPSLARATGGVILKEKRLPRFDLQTYQEHRSRCRASASRLAALKNIHAGDTIFCLGGGKSLLQDDLSQLNPYPVIVCNGAFALFDDHISTDHGYIVVQDYARYGQIYPQLQHRKEKVLVCLSSLEKEHLSSLEFPEQFTYMMPATLWRRKKHVVSRYVHGGVGLSSSPAEPVFTGFSVIMTQIQIAAWMGAKRIVLLGVEMDFTGDPAKDYAISGVKPQYWDFDYKQRIQPMFIHLHKELGKRGVNLINATPAGIVDCMPRNPLKELI